MTTLEEQGRPIMQYVAELEGKVRSAREERDEWRRKALVLASIGRPVPFYAGIIIGVAGSVLIAGIWMIARLYV
jgi:hypothetical protein